MTDSHTGRYEFFTLYYHSPGEGGAPLQRPCEIWHFIRHVGLFSYHEATMQQPSRSLHSLSALVINVIMTSLLTRYGRDR